MDSISKPKDEAGRGQPVPQSPEGATYAPKIHREDALVDWSASAVVIDRQVRAYDPAPGAVTAMRGEVVKIRAAAIAVGPVDGAPGTVIATDANGIVVACGDGQALMLTELQRPGGKRLPARAFLQGFAISPGERFGPVAT